MASVRVPTSVNAVDRLGLAMSDVPADGGKAALVALVEGLRDKANVRKGKPLKEFPARLNRKAVPTTVCPHGPSDDKGEAGYVMIHGIKVYGRKPGIVVYTMNNRHNRRTFPATVRTMGAYCEAVQSVEHGDGVEGFIAWDVIGGPDTLEAVLDHPLAVRWHFPYSARVPYTATGSGADKVRASRPRKPMARQLTPFADRPDTGADVFESSKGDEVRDTVLATLSYVLPPKGQATPHDTSETYTDWE